MTRSPLSAGLLLLTLWSLPARAEIFRGENCAACHRNIRDRVTPLPIRAPSDPHESYDVVVVGSGFSGLTTAYLLRDRNVLVLEKDVQPGGHAQTSSWRGISYPTAVTYFNQVPYGNWAKLFAELELKLVKIPPPQDTISVQGKIVENFWGDGIKDLPYSDEVKAGFRRFNRDINDFVQKKMFRVPLADSRPEAWKYDEMTLQDYLVRQYGEIVATYVGREVQDMLGADPKETSAFAGLAMLCTCTGDDYYNWGAGLSRVTDALAEKLQGRVRTGALVTQVEQQPDGVWINYIKEGRSFRVHSKTAVLAMSPHVIRRIFRNMPPEKEKALSQVRHTAYAVAMLGFREPVWSKSYMLWSNDRIFSSLVFTDWPPAADRSKPGPQVVVAYMPLGSEDARKRLLHTTDRAIRQHLMRDIESVLPGASDKLEEVRIMRWGHAEPLPYPGYLSRVRPLVAAPAGRVFFAGEATEIPVMEGAINSAYRASSEVRRFLSKD